MKNRILTGCLCALGAEFIFGLSYMATKNATEGASAFALLGWRFLIAAVFMTLMAVIGVIHIELRGKKRKIVLMAALLDPILYFLGETYGISNTTASESGAFLACIPVASLIASTILLKERPRKEQIIGIFITLCGVLVTVLAVGASSSFSLIGYLFLLLAVVSYALYSVCVEKEQAFTGTEITYMMLLAGALVFVVLALLEAGLAGQMHELITLPVRDTGFLIAVVYQGIGCSALGFLFSNMAIVRIGVNRTASFIGISTVVSIAAGILLLGESFSMYQVVGAVVILAGVYIANAGGVKDN